MSMITVKFGGTSLADGGHMKKAADIVLANRSRHFVVASAPGKRDKDDAKVTDMLYQVADLVKAKKDYTELLDKVKARYQEIVDDLNIDFDLDSEFAEIIHQIETEPHKRYLASRGEYLCAKVLAKYLGFDYIEAADYITFDEKGNFLAEETNEKLGHACESISYGVIGGFYGSDHTGRIKTFPRGGSDVTGSVLARATRSNLYENWTDVSGLLSADPRVVDNPKVIDYITYSELRELSYMGASVLHEDAVFPVRKAGIPINIRNTNKPEDPGTMIVAKYPEGRDGKEVKGVAGKQHFTSIVIEKTLMNTEVGFVAKVLNIIAKYGISFEHLPTGIDTVSLILATDAFEPYRLRILNEIDETVKPDVLTVEEGISLIAVVGQNMKNYKGIAAKIFKAISEADVNIRMIDQGSSELNVILGVDDADYQKAIQAIYTEIFN